MIHYKHLNSTPNKEHRMKKWENKHKKSNSTKNCHIILGRDHTESTSIC